MACGKEIKKNAFSGRKNRTDAKDAERRDAFRKEAPAAEKNKLKVILAAACSAAAVLALCLVLILTGVISVNSGREKEPVSTARLDSTSAKTAAMTPEPAKASAALSELENTETSAQKTVKDVVPEKTAAPEPEVSWQSLYYEYLLLLYGEEQYPPTFGLCYIDEDEIPELAVGFNGMGRMERVELFTCYKGKMIKLGDVGWFSGFSFMEKKNLLCNNIPVGAMCSHVLVQQITEGKLKTIYEMEISPGDGTGYWMGESAGSYKECTEEEWRAKYQEFFPDSRVSHTPSVDLDDYPYRCTELDLLALFSDPSSVTF